MHIKNAEGDFAIDKIPSKHDDMVLLHAVTLFESFNPSGSVNKLLLAGKERMALGANFHLQLLLGGTSLKRLTAYATDDCLAILGMDFLFHAVSPLLRMPVSGSQNRET